MKHYIIFVGLHQRFHGAPLMLANFGLRDRSPTRFVLNFDGSEKLAGGFVQPDRVTVRTMRFQNRLQLGPDRVVRTLIFRARALVQLENVSFANYANCWMTSILSGADATDVVEARIIALEGSHSKAPPR